MDRASWSDMSHDRSRGGGRHHKDLQLCRQVFDALSYALADLDDPLVADLALASVVPAPTAARMLVTLTPTTEAIDQDAALEAVQRFADDLRADVAAEITRRRVPELVFRVADPRLADPRLADAGVSDPSKL